MTTALPPSSDFTGPSVTEGGFKTGIAALRDYLSGLFGSDGSVATARTGLGLGTGDTPTFGGLNVSGAGTVAGSLTLSKASGAADQLLITDTTSGAGITIGADTNLYRSAANLLATDDNLRFGNGNGISFGGSGVSLVGSTATNTMTMTASGGVTSSGALTTNSGGLNVKAAASAATAGIVNIYGADSAANVTALATIESRTDGGTTGSSKVVISTRAGGGGLSDKFTVNSVGNAGLVVTPSAWGTSGTIFNALEFGAGAVASASTSSFNLFQNAYYNGTDYIYKTTAAASRMFMASGGAIWYGAPSGTAGAAISFAQQMQTNSTATTSGANAAASVLALYKDTGTSRSINAAGTINASGADAAEYEYKGESCGAVAKGQIVGRAADGRLTDKWSQAFSKGIKSTDPHLVGGDTWGTEDKVGMRPEAPCIVLPEYVGTSKPNECPDEPLAPELALPSMPEPQAGESDEIFAVRYAAWQQECAAIQQQLAAQVVLFNLAHAEWCAAVRDHQSAVSQYSLDQQEYATRVELAQAAHEADMDQYQRDLANFEDALEYARAAVDRIAYSGRVPVNVTGAQPGDYIAAAEGPSDTIIGRVITPAEMRADMTLMLDAVGRVHRILDDGRALVAVIVL